MHKGEDRSIFGFWLYLMTDLLMFGVLFAAYSVFRGNTFGGPNEEDLFSLSLALKETLILLSSSFTCGLGMLAAQKQSRKWVLIWFGITYILGLSFLGLEVTEFSKLLSEGNTYQTSAFLSSFFAIVGTHGLHITVGLLWLIILLAATIVRGLNQSIVRKLILFSLFWHFLDIVWIFIFSVVYLMGII